MTVQTTYSLEHGEAYKGMVADLQLCNTVSRLNDDSASLGYGTGVVTGTTEEDAIAPDGSSIAADFIGVVMRELNRVTPTSGTHAAPQDRDMTVVTHGVVWVNVLDAISKDDPVYLRIGATGLGDFSGVIGTGVTEGILLPGVKFVSAGGAGLVKISLGLGG